MMLIGLQYNQVPFDKKRDLFNDIKKIVDKTLTLTSNIAAYT